MTEQSKVLICIPAYNEEANLTKTLEGIDRLPDRIRFGLVVVDDGSSDGTRAICERRGVAVISHVYNLGYGAALKTGYKYAVDMGYDYIIQMDADGQHDPQCVDSIMRALSSPESPDIVIGSRFMRGSSPYIVPRYKMLTIMFFTFLVSVGTGKRIQDPTSGLQGLSRRVFALYAQYDRFALDFPDANMIVQMVLGGYKVMEIPAIMHPRLVGMSMHTGLFKKLRYVVEMTISVLIIYLREGLNARKAREKSA